MKLKPFQKHNYARLALAPGAILSHDTGLGKTWAAYCWAFLKVDYTVSPIHRHPDSPTHSSESESRRNGEPEIQIIPKAPVLIIEPGDLHKQFIDEGQRIFKTNVTALDSQDTFLHMSKLDPATGQRSLPPGFYITSYTQLGSNGVADFPDPLKTHPKVLLQFLALTVESVRAEFERGSIAADPKGYYKLLGVPRCATPAELSWAYRLLSKRYHPDVSTEPNAEEMMKRINAAFKILSWWACGGQLEAHARWPYAITDKDDFAATFCVTERNLTKEAKTEAPAACLFGVEKPRMDANGRECTRGGVDSDSEFARISVDSRGLAVRERF